MTVNTSQESIMTCSSLGLYYGQVQAVKDVSFKLSSGVVSALIGPSGCGKSTLLRSFNRMNDFVEGFRLEGTIQFKGQDIYASGYDPVFLRAQVGMVFQKPNPFPNSIFKNITWGPKINGFRGDQQALVQSSLEKVGLWSEVKDRLHKPAYQLSGGQQQRLCIARTIAMQPEVILMDEPCSALDPQSTARVEELILELKKEYCILMVTHNMQQAKRVSDQTLFMYEGTLVEHRPTRELFDSPKADLTKKYLSGVFG